MEGGRPAVSRVAPYGPDSFGNMVTTTGSESGRNPFRFSTKYTDDETELVYYGHRYYSPETGRWMSRDPAGERHSLNLLLMVQNGVPNAVDPIGLAPYRGCYRGCLDLKEDFYQARRRDPAEDTRNKWWNEFIDWYQDLRKQNEGLWIDYAVTIKCKKCCRWYESLSTGGYAMQGTFSSRKCSVTICCGALIERGRKYPTLFGRPTKGDAFGILIHELTHCVQKIGGQEYATCGSCMCNEIQAYYREHPDWDTDLLIRGARGSCLDTIPNPWKCSAEELELLWRVLDRDKFVKDCKGGGTREGVGQPEAL